MTNFIRIKKGPDCVSGFNLKKKLFMFCVLVSLSQVHAYAISDKSTTGQKNVQSEKIIKGQVDDEDGMPLPGATVSVKGTKTGAITDFDGKFTLKADENSVLVISFMGYETKEIALKGNTTIKVKMQKSSSTLDEVVVVGYGKMKKKDLTGAIVQVKAEALASQNPQTVQDL